MPWVDLQFVTVVFPDHTQFLLHVSNIFYHYLSAVSLDSVGPQRYLKKIEKIVNTFYTKCINIIIDSIDL